MAREEFNRAAVQMANDNPNGVGLNQFSGVLTNNPVYHRGLTVMGNETVAGVCHEVYLLTAAETGWIGMYLFILMIVGLLARQGWGAFRNRGPDSVMIFGFFIGGFMLALSGLLEWVFKTNPILNVYMVMSGFSVGYIARSRQEMMRSKVVQKDTQDKEISDGGDVDAAPQSATEVPG